MWQNPHWELSGSSPKLVCSHILEKWKQSYKNNIKNAAKTQTPPKINMHTKDLDDGNSGGSYACF